MLSRRLGGYVHFGNTPLVFSAIFQPNEIAHYKEIVVMAAIAKLFDTATLAIAAQDICWDSHE
jgi:hypothetical protein